MPRRRRSRSFSTLDWRRRCVMAAHAYARTVGAARRADGWIVERGQPVAPSWDSYAVARHDAMMDWLTRYLTSLPSFQDLLYAADGVARLADRRGWLGAVLAEAYEREQGPRPAQHAS